MRYLVTGANGWIGSAVVGELIAAGHDVVGLVRSDSAAATVAGLGAQVRRGDLVDPAGIAAAAGQTDGVVHLAYHHDFSQMAAAAATDRAVISAIGSALEGTGRPLVVASGLAGFSLGRPVTETDVADPAAHPRAANASLALSYADRGVRPVVVRFAPTVHGPGDEGFVAVLVGVARATGRSAYVGDGVNRWAAVHRGDAATLVRLAVEGAPPGTVVHAVAEEAVATSAIAAAIGTGLGVPCGPVPAEDVAAHLGWIARFFGADLSASSERTRELLGWVPSHPTLLEDLAPGSAYFG